MRLEDIDASEVRRGRALILVAMVGAVVASVAVFGRGAASGGVFLVGWAAAGLGGLAGISAVSRGSGAAGPGKYLAMLAAMLPVVSLAALGAYLAVAQAALGRADRARQQADRAERVAKARTRSVAANGPAARAAKPRAATAVACVKIAGLADRPEGEALSARLSVAGADVPESQMPVLRAARGVFAVAYLVDEGSHYAHVNHDDLQAEGLTPDELHRLAVANLESLMGGEPGLTVRRVGQIHALLMGGHFEASLVLVDSLWDGPLRELAPHGAVVAIPARDMCAFCDARSAAGVAELRELARRVTASGDHLLTETLFLRQAGRWRALPEA